MKAIFVIIALTLTAILYIGYYETLYAEDNKMVFFFKKTPTFQMEFVNLFVSDTDRKELQDLNDEQRQLVIDYCKYRLGIETELKTQSELEACKKR